MTDKVESSPRIPKTRGALDQAIRYLAGAKEILERGGMNSLGLLARRSPGGQPLIAEPFGHVTVMRGMAPKARELNQLSAATEILKAVAVLRDKSR